MNIREVSTWTNRRIFDEIECHGPFEMQAQSVACARQFQGQWITQQQAIQWRAEIEARHHDMDETMGVAHV